MRLSRDGFAVVFHDADLERLIVDLQRNGLVERTRSQVVLSRLVFHGD